MAGNPENVGVWPDADVFISTNLNASNPADAETAFGVDWNLVGLLDGEAGFVESREEDVEDHFAWGGILIRTTRQNFKLTKTFTALEDNATTRALLWPGSDPGELSVPRPASVKIAFELREGTKVKRLISRYRAEVTLNGDITESEGTPTGYELLATIFPDGDGVLFDEQTTDTASS